MPIYEYDCAACRERFEIQASEPALPEDLSCPACKAVRIVRYYGSVSLVTRSRERAASRPAQDPAAGGLRAADPGDLTRDVARRYARAGADSATREVARRAERGDGPTELKEFVRDARSQIERKASSGRPPKGSG